MNSAKKRRHKKEKDYPPFRQIPVKKYSGQRKLFPAPCLYHNTEVLCVPTNLKNPQTPVAQGFAGFFKGRILKMIEKMKQSEKEKSGTHKRRVQE